MRMINNLYCETVKASGNMKEWLVTIDEDESQVCPALELFKLLVAATAAAACNSFSAPAVTAVMVAAAAFSALCFLLMWSLSEAAFLKILSGQMGQGASGSPAPC